VGVGSEALNTPRVSVIVPVRDRRPLLRAAMEGLRAQTFNDFEIVVVDDGSSDGSGDEARSFGARVVRTEGVGAVAARIAGIGEATGDILAFTDSDCVPAAEWLERGVATIDKGADIVVGETRTARSVRPLERSMAHSGHEGLYATCNLFVRRSSYESVGGFDRIAEDRLGFRGTAEGRALGFGEDTLLGWRVARSGSSSVASDAVVFHAVERVGARELIWRTWMAGGFPSLVREVPELRSTLLTQGVLLGPRRVPLYAFAVLAAMRRSRLTLLAALWWAGGHARRWRRRGATPDELIVAVPVEMAIDLVGAAALVWGSIRAREVVL
jgi:hypothetical protein